MHFLKFHALVKFPLGKRPECLTSPRPGVMTSAIAPAQNQPGQSWASGTACSTSSRVAAATVRDSPQECPCRSWVKKIHHVIYQLETFAFSFGSFGHHPSAHATMTVVAAFVSWKAARRNELEDFKTLLERTTELSGQLYWFFSPSFIIYTLIALYLWPNFWGAGPIFPNYTPP